MKKIFIIVGLSIIVLITSLSFIESQRSVPSRIALTIPGYAVTGSLFDKGRTFRLQIYYMGFFPVGIAELGAAGKESFEKRSAFVLSARATVSAFFEKIYPVRAEIGSLVDTTKLYSLRYTETLVMKEKNKTKTLLYDQQNHIARREDLQIKILPDTHDPLSAFFYLLSQKYEVGKKIDLNIVTKEENYDFLAQVIAKTGDIWELKVFVGRQDRSSAHGGTFHLWVLDKGDCKVPLALKAWTQVGLITGRLIEAQ